MKQRSKWVSVLAGVILVLVVARVAAPYVAEWYLNKHLLADLGDYRGEVGDIDLAVWRGAVRFEDFLLEKARGSDWIDFVIAPRTEASISRRGLLNGTLRIEAVLETPEINFVDAENPNDQQTGSGIDWQVIPADILRLSLERIEIRQGKLAFRNFTSEPQVNLQAHKINAIATNLTNLEEEEGERVATAKISAEILGDSPLNAEAEFNPFDYRSFIFAADVVIRDITKLNNFAQAYANLDFKKGEGELTVELEAKDGRLEGYAKPAFENLEIVNWKQDVEDQNENVLRVMWEGVTGALSGLFSNPETDALATRVEISGEIPDSPDVDVWGAVFGIVRNAFSEAINTDFEGTTPLDVPDAEEKDVVNNGNKDGHTDNTDEDDNG